MQQHPQPTPPGSRSAEPRLNRKRLEQPVATLFEEQARSCPSRLAVKSGRHSFSYAALDQKAAGIARKITTAGGADSEPVGLLFDPDAPLVSAMLGVLKAGKVCVPLRPSQPLARLRRALRSAGARLIVTDTDSLPVADEVRDSVEHVLNVDVIQPCPDRDESSRSPSPDSAAYILYTSGSSGEPRGVVHTHRSLLHLVLGSTDALRITSEDRIALLPSSSFIGAARNLFGALLNGASLHPFDVNAEGLDRFAAWLADEQITIYHFVPTFFRHFVSSLDGRISFPTLRLVYLGGEPVRKTDVDSFRKHFAPDAVLVNGYGTTETGAIRRLFIDRETSIDGAVVPVGYPAADKEVLILDETGQPLETGCVGEIAVRSRYLSAGYWRRPQATRAAFSVVSGDGGEVLYRTGDLGRVSTDGCLEHLGRRDSQVKIRGHRVEIAEIETLLLDIPSTTDVAVVPREDRRGETRLVAYVASSSPSDLNVEAVRRVLETLLPQHAIPTSFVFMEAIPRTPRGKLERFALPDPPAGRPQLGVPFVAPRTDLERLLARQWSDVLQVDEIGVDDNFLQLGGESLRATRLLNRIQRHLDKAGHSIPMTALFDSPTVAAFADYLERNHKAAVASLISDDQRGGAAAP